MNNGPYKEGKILKLFLLYSRVIEETFALPKYEYLMLSTVFAELSNLINTADAN